MPREIEIVSRRSFDHVEQRLECLLGAQSEHPSRAHQCPFLGEQRTSTSPDRMSVCDKAKTGDNEGVTVGK